MVKPKNSNGPTPSKSAEQVYQRAVAAYKSQKYDQALALFHRLGKLPPSSPYYIKALMGQVRVHQRLDQPEQASLICRQLIDSTSPKASQWASQVLDQLPQPTEPPPIAFSQTTDLSTAADLSGFLPLEPPKNSLPNVAQPSPPESSAPAAETVGQPAENGLSEVTSAKPAKKGANAAAAISDSGYRSLFHFQQLNQQSGEEQDIDQPSPSALADPALKANPVPSPSVSTTTSQRVQPRRSLPGLPQRPLALWLGQGATAIALCWAINWAFHFVLTTVNSGLQQVRLSLPGAGQSYTVWLIIGLVLLALASPWILDYALAAWHRQKPLSTRQLQAKNPEVLRLLRQVCRQQGWQMPELRLIPDSAPLCFSYGWLPGNTRIVVSQGVLDQCSDEVLLALYGYELARMVNSSLPVLSAAGLLLLLLYTGYRWLAEVGDSLTLPLGRNLLGLLASIVYGLFWLLRQLLLWLSRLCSSWADRRTIALTHHPDHLADGLVQLTQAIAAHLQQQGTLHPLQISLEVLMPVSSRQAITPGSLLATRGENRPSPLTMLVATEGLNPYRQWLRVNASHPPLGERLLWLNHQAKVRGQPQLGNDQLPSSTPTSVSLPLLFLQKGPLAGLVLGGGLAMGLWFFGGIVNRLGWYRLSWLYQDPSILVGGLWLGLGLGMLARINVLFPEAKARPGKSSTDTVAALVDRSLPLPVEGLPVTLKGTLRGSPSIGNWGCQDLYLEDTSGIVKLINPLPAGSLQGWLQDSNHPRSWVGHRVTVIGWGRHGGGMTWVDIHQIQIDSRHQFMTYGPIWATLISLGSSLIGIATIFRGG